MEKLDIVVGTEKCPIQKIESLLRNDPKIRENWPVLASELGIPSATRKDLRQNLLLNKIIYSELLSEILDLWVAQSGNDAKLKNLMIIVEDRIGAKGAGSNLRLHFDLPCKGADYNPSIKWNALGSSFQEKVIENLAKFFPTVDFTTALPKLEGAVLIHLMSGKMPEIFKNTLLPKPSHYIDRTLVTRNIISDKIFEDESSSDVFLFTGMDRAELSGLTTNMTAGSGEQLYECSSNIRFLILDQNNHFDRICENTSNPVHLLRREQYGRKLMWVKSRGDMTNLQKYVDQCQNELDEEAFCKELDPQTTSVCISDSPGMGKSYLLGQIGRILKKLRPYRNVFFIMIVEFIKLVKLDVHLLGMRSAVEKALALTVCKNVAGEAVLGSMLQIEAGQQQEISLELLFDGFDEADPSNKKLAEEILLAIQHYFGCARLWVTSRPHLLQTLENTFSLLGYNIKGFDMEDQIQFLSSSWSSGADVQVEKLTSFARHCLTALKSTMSSTEEDIAGIPLQCSLIGQVYRNEALEYAATSKGSGTELLCEFEIGTVPQLYKLLIDKKFQKYYSLNGWQKLEGRDIMDMHARLGLQLILPDCVDKTHDNVPVWPQQLEELLKLGILESSSTTESPRFVHRTLAEYFVAWFVADGLGRAGDGLGNGWFVSLFMEHCLGCRESQVGLGYRRLGRIPFKYGGREDYVPSYEFRYAVISYFVNFFLSDYCPRNNTFYSPCSEALLDPVVRDNFFRQQTAHGCVNMDCVYIFKYFFRSHSVLDKDYRDVFTSQLLLLSIQQSSLELFRWILHHFEKHREFDLNIQRQALSMAVICGKVTILEFLLKEKQLRRMVEKAQNGGDGTMSLVTKCVSFSFADFKSELERKKLVLRMLIGINPFLLEMSDENNSTPFTSNWVHPQLITELVKLGADVCAQDNDGGTVLHKIREYWSKNDYQFLLENMPETKLSQLVRIPFARTGYTPLMSLLRVIHPLPQTLDLFKRLNADFNHMNAKGNTVLKVTIQERRSREVVRKVIQLGANLEWCWKGKRWSILQKAAEYGNVEAVQFLVDQIGMDVNKVVEDDNDDDRLTVLDLAIKHNYRVEVGMALRQRGCNFKQTHEEFMTQGGRTHKGVSCLHIAAYNHHIRSVKLLLNFGLSTNQADDDGNSALHFLLMKAEGRRGKYFSIAELLLENDSDPNLENNEGHTPLGIASENSEVDLKTFQLLQTKNHD